MDLSFVIINWNTRQLLLDCLATIYGTVHRSAFEVFVVDNGSSDGSVEAVAKAFPDVKLIVNGKNLGFARANNLALEQAQGKYAVLLNSDTLLREGAIESMVDFMERHPEAGICGPQLLNRDGSKQGSIGPFPTLMTEFVSKKVIKIFFPDEYRKSFVPKHSSSGDPFVVDFIVGACMMARKSAVDRVGMLDPDYFFLYEEVDWCFRMKRDGWKVYHIPQAAIYHLGGQSMKEINLRARVETWQSRYLYFRKNLGLGRASWYGLLALGMLQNAYQFLVYTVMSGMTLFLAGRPRRRWMMFGYLLVWHLRGRPTTMGIPR